MVPNLSNNILDDINNNFDEEFTRQEIRETEVPADWQKQVEDNH